MAAYFHVALIRGYDASVIRTAIPVALGFFATGIDGIEGNEFEPNQRHPQPRTIEEK